MAEGPASTPVPTPESNGPKRTTIWSAVTRNFMVALDPRKLLAAACGILLMSLGWYVLSLMFNYEKPLQGNAEYQSAAMQKQLGAKKADGSDYTEADYTEAGKAKFERDYAQWKLRNELAGPGGTLRTMPWNEARGPNPFLFASNLISLSPTTWTNQIVSYISQQIPVLAEPLFKLVIPVIKLIDPNATFMTRLYLLLCLAWSVAVWAFFGGIITRLAAVQLGGKSTTTLKATVKFVISRYMGYILSPTVPLGIIAVIVLCMFLYGLVALIPIVGDILLYGLLFPLIIIGGVVMAVILLGLAGYPLMYCTVSVEGSDTFDAVSRSYNYVLQSPWQYVWNWLVSLAYGAVVTFVVILVGSLTIVLGKWAVGSAAGVTTIESRRPDFLFVYAPESLGWKELLLKGSDAAVVTFPNADGVSVTQPVNQERYDTYMNAMSWNNYAGAGLVSFWMVAMFLVMIGFSYSYFWTAATTVYLLMRHKIDDLDVDEVFTDEDEAILKAPVPEGTGSQHRPGTEPTPAATTDTATKETPAPAPVVPPPVTPPVSPPAPPVVPPSPPAPPVVPPPPPIPPVVPPPPPPPSDDA